MVCDFYFIITCFYSCPVSFYDHRDKWAIKFDLPFCLIGKVLKLDSFKHWIVNCSI